MGEDSKAWIVEEITDGGHVYRLEGGNNGGWCFSCGEAGHMAGSCSRNAWSKNGKNVSMKKSRLVYGGVGESVLDVEKRAIM